MSVEHMLPDTSIVKMIVVWFVGTPTTTAGRPIAGRAPPAPRDEGERQGAGGTAMCRRGIANQGQLE